MTSPTIDLSSSTSREISSNHRVDTRAEECDTIDNQIDVLGKTFLGLTIACARCHDHKFDPLTTKDYYALAGYLQSSRQQHAILDEPRPANRIAAELAARSE